jgi:hypothetical protein
VSAKNQNFEKFQIKLELHGGHCRHYLLGVVVITDTSTAGIVLQFGLDNWDSTVRFLVGAENFSLHHHIQNGSGTHPASCPVGTRGSFPGSKSGWA